ncbi:hypothetical protein BGZ75_002083 [Mortierella antarctica]|nr:hypothetical protein BGZ75_002083 [Mortierella antarctica]
MPGILSTRTSLASLSYLLFASSSLLLAVSAQALVPIAVWGPAYTHQEGKSFIIQGGQSAEKTLVTQTFSIDLSTAWDTSAVPYTRLADGPSNYVHASALLKDKQNWVVVTNGTVNEYSLTLGTWSSSGSTYLGKYDRVPAAADPDTDLIYFPNSYFNQTVQMLQYDISRRYVNFFEMHPALANVFSYSATWNTQLRKMVVFGGAITGNIVNNNLYTWDRVNLWVAVAQKGDIPPPRRSACMVSAYNGAKIVVFGGLNQLANSALSDIYVLDVATMTWTKGADAGGPSARTETACAVTNDLFIAWGGAGVNTVITSNLTVIYNLKRNIWQSTYSPKPDPGSTPSSGAGGGDGSGDPPESKSNMGAIIGGVVGGVVVIALAIGFFVYRRKQSNKKVQAVPTTEQQNYHGGAPAMSSIPPSSGPGDAYYTSNIATPALDPWTQQQQLQQQQQQQPLVYATSYPQTHSTYSTYQPPIIHDYQQQQLQHQPQIFQPASPPFSQQQQQQQLYPGGAMSPPISTVSAGSPSLDQYQHSTVYQPSDASTAGASPTVEHYQKVQGTPTNVNRPPPQNPQTIVVPDHYTS